MKTKKSIIPIFFAIDDNYAKFLQVALKSIICHASKDYKYNIHILNTKLDPENIKQIKQMETCNFSIYFENVSDKLKGIANKLQLRDYFTLSIYYRLFIASMFPMYDKAIYLDSDLVCIKDISKFYNIDITNYLLAATPEEVMQSVNCFGEYSEVVCGVERKKYFNSGILLLNLKKFREEKIEESFIKLLDIYKFKVAPDQDYLNILCKNRTLLLPAEYNKTPVRLKGFNYKKLFFIHYKINWKPWKYSNVLYERYFWKYAKQTLVFKDILAMRDNYSNKSKKIDSDAYKNLIKLAKDEILKFKKTHLFINGERLYGIC